MGMFMTEYTSSTKRFCSVFKSSRKAEMYVYVDRKQGTDALPEGFSNIFGTPLHVMDMVLTPEKKLARAEAGRVLESIEEQGYYLQMPPADGPEVIDSTIAPPKDSLHG